MVTVVQSHIEFISAINTKAGKDSWNQKKKKQLENDRVIERGRKMYMRKDLTCFDGQIKERICTWSLMQGSRREFIVRMDERRIESGAKWSLRIMLGYF